MATMTMTATRSTPSFNPPLTQNTAPVHEYRCMFSHDAHKKKPTFHDGTLKFHTFNSRVMVYDLDRHYIGDLHYRDDDGFGEGLEFRLDRGVLVQVQDRLGETQTDLEQVLNSKNKDDDAASHPSPAPPRPLRLNAAAASQQKPRSLKDVLAASQSQRARGRVTYQSPYEQRQALATVQPVEPPAKRQKVVRAGKENVPLASARKPDDRPVPKAPLKRKAVLPKSKPVKDAVLHFQEVIDLSSEEEVQPPPKPRRVNPKNAITSAKVRDTGRQKAQPVSPVPAKTQQAPSSRAPPKSRKHQSSMVPVDSTSRHRDSNHGAGSGHSKATPLSARSRLLASSGSARVTLTIPSSKPRPKLMYRALLPPSIIPRDSPVALSAASPVPADGSFSLPPPNSNTSDPKQLDQQFDEFEDDDHMGSCDVENHKHSEDIHAAPQEPANSPLFVPSAEESPSQGQSSQPSHDNLDERMFAVLDHAPEVTSWREPMVDAGEKHNDKPSPIGNADEKTSTPILSSEANGPVTHDRDLTEPRVSESSFELMPPPQAMLPPSRTRIPPLLRDKSFRRVLSENDASFTQEVADEDFLGLTTQALGRKPRNVIGASPSKLRRTASDSAAIGNEDDVPADAMEPIAEVAETGPWTSMEAFLLFERWPPGKDKPDFGQPTTTDLGNFHSGPGFQGITTAREMLRDDVNVL